MDKKTKISILIVCLTYLVAIAKVIAIPQMDSLEELSQTETWKAILQIDQENNKILLDEDFYLSEFPLDPLAEMKALCNNMNSSNIEKFPARYFFIKENTNFDVPLEENKQIQNYLAKLKADSVSVIFASSYLGSPMSYFGHTYLKFNKEDNLYFSQTLGFAAEVPSSMGQGEMIVKGATGNLKGKYEFSPFFVIANKYLRIQQRFLIEYKLKLTKYEVDLLALYALELSSKDTNYHFFSKNCTSALQTLMNIVTIDFDFHKRIFNMVMPYDMVNTLIHNDAIKETYFHSPVVNQLMTVYEKLSIKDKMFYNRLLKSKNKDYFLKNKYSGDQYDRLAFILNNHYDLLFKRFNKSPLDYRIVDSIYYKMPTITNDYTYEPLSKPIKITYKGIINDKQYLNTFKITPLFFNRRDDRINNIAENTLEVMSITTSFNTTDVNLTALDIIKIESYQKFYSFFPVPSWSLYLGFNEVYDQDLLRFTIESGIGIAFGNTNYMFYLMPNIIFIPYDFNIGIEKKIGISTWLGPFHIGIDSSVPLIFNSSYTALSAEVYLRLKLGKNILVGTDYELTEKRTNISLSLRF